VKCHKEPSADRFEAVKESGNCVFARISRMAHHAEKPSDLNYKHDAKEEGRRARDSSFEGYVI
jgi:hypothetical protein